MNTVSETWAFADGITAGGAWFNRAIDKGDWEAPDNPFPQGSAEAEEWARGLQLGFSALEDAYFA